MLGKELKGRYRIVEALGNGGFGKTFLAEDTHRPGSPLCVVKQLMPLCRDLKFLQMARRLFRLEAETLERLGRHDQIPQLLAYFEEDEEFYLVEEYIKGPCLKDELVPGKKLSASQVVSLLKNILNVLAFIHSEGVIHRDIKPSNIVRRESDGELVLIDFGAVKQIQPQLLKQQENVALTSLTIAIGTNDYSPLEQLAGQPRLNSDIYALGIVGIQALSGVLPRQIKRDSDSEALIWHHLSPVNNNLAKIIDKMTHIVFAERYQSATEVLEDLEQWKPCEAAASPSIAPTVVSVAPVQTPLSERLIVTAEQRAQLEEILSEHVGIIGPLLLQDELKRTSNFEELIKNLSSHIPQPQRIDFQKQVKASLKKPSIDKPSAVESHVDISKYTSAFQASLFSDDFLEQCEHELTNAIGPVGTMLMQKTIQAYPQLSSEELVEVLASEISDAQKAAEFRRRLLS